MSRLLDAVAATGRTVIHACRVTGQVAIFAASGISHIFRPPFYGRLFLSALLEIGFFSLPVVALTAIFTGMVLALQSYTGFSRFSAEGAVANVVVLSVTRELGPAVRAKGLMGDAAKVLKALARLADPPPPPAVIIEPPRRSSAFGWFAVGAVASGLAFVLASLLAHP